MSKKKSEASAFDFDSLLTVERHEAGAEMEIVHPDSGESTGVFLLLKGVDSKTFRASQAEFNRKRALPNADEDALVVEHLVRVTDGWRGMKRGGAEMPFSKDAIRSLYTDSPKIALNVVLWIQGRRGFTKG